MSMPESQKRWEKDNTVCVNIRINRNQDPELYQMLADCHGSRGTIIRELLSEALAARKAKAQ